MSLRTEVENLIRRKNPRKSEHLSRDMEIMLEYFGLGEAKFPTQESLGDKYKIRKQYISKDIIKVKFKDKVQIAEIPILSTVEEILNEYNFIFYSDFKKILVDRNLIDETVWLKGLFNLFNCFSLCQDFDIYTLKGSKATKFDIEHDEDFLIIKKTVHKQLKTDIQKLLKLPGRIVGICCLDDVYENDESFRLDFADAKRVLKNTDSVWCKEINGKFWYIVQKPEALKRDNPIITALRKLKGLESRIGNRFEKDILSEVLANTLDKRSNDFEKPDTDVIRIYLDGSRFIQPSDNHYALNGNLEGRELNEIEVDLINYCSEHTVSPYSNISKFLKSLDKGYSKPNIDKNIYNSPFLYKREAIDPNGRETYDFVFIANFSQNIESVVEGGYEFVREKLLGLYGETDADREQKQRREQSILRRWLFKDKARETCALCGKEFSVDSLVAAHKKPRAICSENERTDPYIVMPLCKFGCDQVYEKRWVRISNGCIEPNDIEVNSLSANETEYVNTLTGRRLDEAWIKGDASYFDLG